MHHANGGVYVVDLKSSHGTHVNGKRLAPYQATLLRAGGVLAFGASSRTYTLDGVPAAPPSAAPVADDGPSASSSARDSGGAMEGPLMPGEERKRKYTPADAKAKKRAKWLAGPKSTSRMSENERVARMAGSGSGCFGPGFD